MAWGASAPLMYEANPANGGLVLFPLVVIAHYIIIIIIRAAFSSH